MLSEAITLNGAPSLMIILHELRARVRTGLGLWKEASEDVRVALKGLEHVEGCGIDGIDSEEERMEVRHFYIHRTYVRWRRIYHTYVDLFTTTRRRASNEGYFSILAALLVL